MTLDELEDRMTEVVMISDLTALEIQILLSYYEKCHKKALETQLTNE